ncbi:amidohydrolase family protein [Candidatus Woesearchaeota archaeon]|nr:amidohydrolase family protein [Candidatus Woesearchaeota archaeon]MBT5271892.1 amidohydrolase family protein [Candidatus Woesearchaeota archaeon]MBT6040701.1 amidohydrolase family protein [Candidatus Woesearchaeota archaeon]MBT6336180.1 amidohydrolase family protein [Candidatus Woesearchaeota archaeon]MBT7928053.1 amidohydrolase family protein [Candidatus Woesearchaeota archaeon]
MSLLLKNCKIFKGGDLILGQILISEGKIKTILLGENGDELIAEKIIDCANNILFPGLIDPHVHFREPGMEHKEDFLTGSCAAAAGGITTVLDMPNTNPPTFTLDLLNKKRRLAEKSIVNYGFYFGASAENNVDEIKKVISSDSPLENIAAIKIYMNDTTGNLLITNDDLLDKIFVTAKTNEKMIAVHAEGEMIKKAITLAKRYMVKLYLCHVSTKEELDYIRANKTPFMFVEVTPHHLFLSEDDDKDAFTKMKPELKSNQDQNILLRAVTNEVIDTVGTDHAPHTLEDKKQLKFPHGVPGCETMLPLLLNAVNEGKFNLKKVQELCCENPAKIFGIKNKGFIKEGYDADLVIIDIGMERVVDNDKLFTKCKWSPFAGKKLKGWPIMTIVNGNVVYDYNLGEVVLKTNYYGEEVNYNV